MKISADGRTAVDKVRFEEIVDDIVRLLEPLKFSKSKRDVAKLVRETLELIPTQIFHWKERLSGTPKDTLKYIKDLNVTIKKLEKLLLTMPNRIAFIHCKCEEGRLLLMGAYNPTKIYLVSPQFVSDADTRRAQLASAAVQAPEDRFRKLLSDLKALQAELVIAKRCPGPDPRYEIEKTLCAEHADILIADVSDRHPDELQSIASLIYEAITGEHGAQLQRQCRAVRTSLATWVKKALDKAGIPY